MHSCWTFWKALYIYFWFQYRFGATETDRGSAYQKSVTLDWAWSSNHRLHYMTVSLSIQPAQWNTDSHTSHPLSRRNFGPVCTESLFLLTRSILRRRYSSNMARNLTPPHTPQRSKVEGCPPKIPIQMYSKIWLFCVNLFGKSIVSGVLLLQKLKNSIFPQKFILWILWYKQLAPMANIFWANSQNVNFWCFWRNSSCFSSVCKGKSREIAFWLFSSLRFHPVSKSEWCIKTTKSSFTVT